MELFNPSPLLNSQHSRFENLNYTPLNHWTVAAHSNQLTCYQVSNPQSGCHVSFAIYHNSCHICPWIDKILKALTIAIKCLHDDYVSGCIDCSCLQHQCKFSDQILADVHCAVHGRTSPRGLNNETHWNFRPKQLKPNHTIYSYKIFTYIAKKSRRGGGNSPYIWCFNSTKQ
jgi:hypothetical protein